MISVNYTDFKIIYVVLLTTDIIDYINIQTQSIIDTGDKF